MSKKILQAKKPHATRDRAVHAAVQALMAQGVTTLFVVPAGGRYFVRTQPGKRSTAVRLRPDTAAV